MGVFAGVDLPWLARIGLCGLGGALAWRAGREAFLLRSPHAPQVLAWNHAGDLTIRRADGRWSPATLAAGSFRLGRAGLFLWLNGCDRKQALFIDAGRQNETDLRRLLRWLNCHSVRAPGERGPPS